MPKALQRKCRRPRGRFGVRRAAGHVLFVDPTRTVAMRVVEVSDLSGNSDDIVRSVVAAGARFQLLAFPERPCR